MQTFKDTVTSQYWQFDDHDDLRLLDGIYQAFDVNGNRVTSVPDTLEPSEMPPVEPPATPPKTTFAPREYLKKFTMQEYAAARTHENIGVQWALDNLIGAQFVDIEDPDTIAGLDLMVAEGVITPERRDELLTPQAAE